MKYIEQKKGQVFSITEWKRVLHADYHHRRFNKSIGIAYYSQDGMTYKKKNEFRFGIPMNNRSVGNFKYVIWFVNQ